LSTSGGSSAHPSRVCRGALGARPRGRGSRPHPRGYAVGAAASSARRAAVAADVIGDAPDLPFARRIGLSPAPRTNEPLRPGCRLSVPDFDSGCGTSNSDVPSATTETSMASPTIARVAPEADRLRRNSAGEATAVGRLAARARVRHDGCSSARACRCRAPRPGLPSDPDPTCGSTLATTPVTTLGS